MALDEVERAELEALKARVARLEQALAIVRPPSPRAPSPAEALAARAAAPPVVREPRASVLSGANLETLLGKQFAPRVGAILVFLAALFFLGVGIERGWIGPAFQLVLASAAAVALFGVGAWLTRKRGYGTYPQVLEGTGATMLYAVAFVSHALPYYREVTGLSQIAGGLLLAVVATATIALAWWRDARGIASLGFTLGFITTGIGFEVFPSLSLAYVGILGGGLALLVARKGWIPEAAVGSVVVGTYLVMFAVDALDGDVATWLVLLVAAVPFAGFVWVTISTPATLPRPLAGAAGILALATLTWAVLTSTIPLAKDPIPAGVVILAFSFAAGGLAVKTRAIKAVAASYGVGALTLFVIGPIFLWGEVKHTALAAAATHVAGALALLFAFLARRAPPFWVGSAGLALVAGLFALLYATFQGGPGVTLAIVAIVVASAGVLIALSRTTPAGPRHAVGTRTLVTASAILVALLVMAEAPGALVSVLLGALGVAYLVAGFLLREGVHRYVGFAMLGFVVFRIFVVDLAEADLVIRALVFLALGGILLGVGYAYARVARKAAPPQP